MNFLFNRKPALKLNYRPYRLISPLTISDYEISCYIAQVTPAEVHHIYGIVSPQKQALAGMFDKGSRYSHFNEPPERKRRQCCLPTAIEFAGRYKILMVQTWVWAV